MVKSAAFFTKKKESKKALEKAKETRREQEEAMAKARASDEARLADLRAQSKVGEAATNGAEKRTEWRMESVYHELDY